jgi:hypothetical protein
MIMHFKIAKQEFDTDKFILVKMKNGAIIPEIFSRRTIAAPA